MISVFFLFEREKIILGQCDEDRLLTVSDLRVERLVAIVAVPGDDLDSDPDVLSFALRVFRSKLVPLIWKFTQVRLEKRAEIKINPDTFAGF